LALKGARDVRIMTQHPTTPWSKVWANLHAVWSSEELTISLVYGYSWSHTHQRPTSQDTTKYHELPTLRSSRHWFTGWLSVAKGPTFGGGPVPEERSSFAWTRNTFYRSGPSIWVFTFGHHRGIGQFCGSSPTWYITVNNTGIEYRPSTTLISWGVPDGKHIK